MKTIVLGVYLLLLLLAFFLTDATSLAQNADSTRPHVRQLGKNLVSNPSVKTRANWLLVREAEHDAATSRTEDGSGSFKLVTPLPDASMAFSDVIAVRPGQQYTYRFYIKTDNGPTYVGAQISLHDTDQKYLRNLDSARGGTTHDGEWQEFALPFTVPEGVAFVGLQVYKTDNTKPGGIVWADDFYLGEGLGLEQPPSAKKPFDGAAVRVDALGNFEVKRKGVWEPFFPLCMYSDNYRDWSVYSTQGWNTIIWTGDAQQVQQAKDAKSEFNPDGMMAGFAISQYTMPGAWAYNNIDDLRAKLKGIFDRGLGDNLLFYYWDNENHHDQWQVPAEVIETIRRTDVDSTGARLHPIFALQGTYNIARVHAARGLVDVSGTYFGGDAAETGMASGSGEAGFFILDREEGQTSPAALAQFNGVNGSGDMRLRLYNAIILGARSMGYWRDCYGPNQKEAWSVGRVDEKPWWPDFPNLRREVDQLLPIIREAHWTKWKATVDRPAVVHVGTREHKGERYLIVVNQTTTEQKVTVTIAGLPHEAKDVRDVLDDKHVASIGGNSFSVSLPGIGINSGTKVLRLVSSSRKP